MSSASTPSIVFPSDINGVSEVGIAANVDEITDPAYHLKVATRHVGTGSRVTETVSKYPLLGELARVHKTSSRTVFSDAVNVSHFATAETPQKSMEAFLARLGSIKSATTPVQSLNLQTAGKWTVERLMEEVDINKTMTINACPFASDSANVLWNSLVAVVVANRWYPKSSKYVIILSPSDSANQSDTRSVDDINAAGFLPSQTAATLIAATKVSWWMTNHHVGQKKDQILSFAGKVYGSLDMAGDVEENRKILWAAGKWSSTLSFLKAFGVKGLVCNSLDYAPNGIQLSGSTDVMLRIKSRPAGTADVNTHLAVARHASRSVFCVVIPPVDDLDKMNAEEAKILANPAAFHMGAYFLTGAERIVPMVPSEETKANLAGYIHAASPSGTLAKADVVAPKAEVLGNMVYTSIVSIKSQLAASVTSAAVRALVDRMRGGGAAASLATQTKRLTIKDAQEAIDLSKSADAKVAAGSPEASASGLSVSSV